MTSTNRPPLPYLINVPEDQVTALNKFMKERRIQFSPMENLLVINGGSPDTPVFHGDQIPDLIAEINGHLEGDHDISPAVPENCREWSLDTCREFLELAIREFSWSEEYQVQYNHFGADPEQWQDITERYPRIFQT